MGRSFPWFRLKQDLIIKQTEEDIQKEAEEETERIRNFFNFCDLKYLKRGQQEKRAWDFQNPEV